MRPGFGRADNSRPKIPPEFGGCHVESQKVTHLCCVYAIFLRIRDKAPFVRFWATRLAKGSAQFPEPLRSDLVNVNETEPECKNVLGKTAPDESDPAETTLLSQAAIMPNHKK